MFALKIIVLSILHVGTLLYCMLIKLHFYLPILKYSNMLNHDDYWENIAKLKHAYRRESLYIYYYC